MAHRPVGTGSSIAFTAGVASTSNPFTVQSSVLRVVSTNAAAHISIGASPSATSVDYYVPSGGTATLALTKASNRVVGVITGTTTTIIVPEGTQVPFIADDFVTLTSTNQSYYNFTHQKVLSVDNTAGFNGYFQTRMVVDYNSSGIVTAFSSPDASITRSNKVSAYGTGAGTLYFQQVQISGDA
jgi:hypothetical protein